MRIPNEVFEKMLARWDEAEDVRDIIEEWLDSLPTKVILHVWQDSQQVYASERALLDNIESSGSDEEVGEYLRDMEDALARANSSPGVRTEMNSGTFYDREYVVVFTKLEGGD